jgi:hypothetical protein
MDNRVNLFDPASRLREWIKTHDRIVEGLAAEGKSRQQALRHPQARAIHRQAWNAAPAEAKAIIDRILASSGTKTDNHAKRYAYLDWYISGGVEALFAEEKRIADSIAKARDARAKRPERTIERQVERISASAEERRARRTAKALELIKEARERGLELHSTGRCMACGKPLTDAISRLYRLGSGCRAEAFRRHGRRAVEEVLGIKSKEAAR